MEFLSVQQAADKFGVTVRTVQKWAKENKLSGAKKVGREWLIPIVATGTCDSEFDKGLEDKKLTDAEIPLIILKESFTPGSCLEHIEKINDADSKNIAMAEYYYLRGEIEKSASIFERYVNHSDESISFSASFLYSRTKKNNKKNRRFQNGNGDFFVISTVQSILQFHKG